MDLNEAENIAKEAGSAVSGASSFLGKAGSFLETLIAKIILGLVLLAVVAALAYFWGKASVKAEYEKKLADRDAYLLKLQQENDRKQERIVVQYVDKVRTIDREVKVYVPSHDDCSQLSGHFRLFLDSAASGIQLPAGARNTDGAPVPVEDVANTVSDNYATCRKNAEQLKAMQDERRAISGSH